MVTPLGRRYLQVATVIMALWSFFFGVFFAVWGQDLTSPVWILVMSGPLHGELWTSLLFLSGLLFLFGIEWENVWPRAIGCIVSATIYLAIGVTLAIAPIWTHDTLNGSFGMWILGALLHYLLAGLMWAERTNNAVERK